MTAILAIYSVVLAVAIIALYYDRDRLTDRVKQAEQQHNALRWHVTLLTNMHNGLCVWVKENHGGMTMAQWEWPRLPGDEWVDGIRPDGTSTEEPL